MNVQETASLWIKFEEALGKYEDMKRCISLLSRLSFLEMTVLSYTLHNSVKRLIYIEVIATVDYCVSTLMMVGLP